MVIVLLGEGGLIVARSSIFDLTIRKREKYASRFSNESNEEFRFGVDKIVSEVLVSLELHSTAPTDINNDDY